MLFLVCSQSKWKFLLKMKFSGWQKETLVDWKGKIATTVFVNTCNYNCGYCHNSLLRNAKANIDEKEIIEHIKEEKRWLDALVFCGGEPTTKLGLKNFARKIKGLGLLVKLDTNGSNPGVLQELKEERLIDYVAMDVKGPLELYPQIIGRGFIDERDFIGKGIALTSQFPDYEFRTTVVPIYKNGKVNWMSPNEIGEAAKLIRDWGEEDSKYYLQKFVARGDGEILENKFSKNYLPKDMWETPKEHLEACKKEAQKYLKNVYIRGQ